MIERIEKLAFWRGMAELMQQSPAEAVYACGCIQMRDGRLWPCHWTTHPEDGDPGTCVIERMELKRQKARDC